jgi:hypothetical protein
VITVDRRVVVVDRRPVLASPKTTSSVRDAPMPAFLQTAIAEHARAQAKVATEDAPGPMCPENAPMAA